MRPLRILLVTNKCPPDFDGGFELRAFQLAQGLRRRGHEVEVVTSKFRDTFKGERKDPPWVHRVLRYVPISGMRGPIRHLDRGLKFFESTWVGGENVQAMEKFLEGRDYDIAYIFGLLRVSYAVAGPIQRKGLPVLWHCGDSTIADRFYHAPKKIFGYEPVMNLLSGGWYAEEKKIEFRHVAYVSNFLRVRERDHGHRPPFSYLIPRGIDFQLATDVDRERATPPTFFMACRVDPIKGVHNAIAAAGMVLRQRPELPWVLEIAGQTSHLPVYRDQLDQQIAAEGLQDRVKFIGQLPHAQVIEKFRSATAFLFTSIFGEPFSSTIIEAMACGTPLIGADDGSILEVVEPGVSGLVYPRNEPAELAKHLIAVLDDPALRHRIALAGLDVIAKRYTIDRILDLTENTMHVAIEDKRRNGASEVPAATTT